MDVDSGRKEIPAEEREDNGKNEKWYKKLIEELV